MKALVESFIKKYGDEYIGADDKWVLVDDYLAEKNHQSEDLTDDIDEAVYLLLISPIIIGETRK